ncbi:TPA: hypothetical protein ACTUT5_001341 [Legionella anisa]|uniref:hypothetical protein n=1 Tax=Legionella anisa TaxID=28082 RepID=UPI00197E1212|nr:hypothetical protein [Legionella anisa]MBN5935865.1 hypothetical protein [Legionella anisa]
MATSSAVLQSFLRDAFKDKKKLADLSFEDLLRFNRAECGLISLYFDPEESIDELESWLNGNDAIILYNNELYHAYTDAQGRKVRKFPEPEPDDKKVEDYTRLKASCSEFYKRARGDELDWVRSVTDRAYTEHRSDHFLSSLDFYLGILGQTDRVMFDYMNDAQKEELAFNLKITLLLLLAQKQHEIEYQKTENVNTYNQHIKRCSKFLMELDPEYQERIKKHPEQEEVNPDQPIKYMGIPLGQLLARDMVDMTGGATKTIKEYMGKINEGRLYWVWGSTFLKTVVGHLPDYMYAAQAPDAMKTPDPYTGNLSWTLYYARFFLELGLLLKHTIKGSWMSEEEAKIPWEERFLTQWSQRKFALLNDFLWGTANLLCFFKLNGAGALGTAGDALTLVLLIFDIAMVALEFAEQKAKYQKAMLQYDQDIERLENQLKFFLDQEKERQLQDDELRQKRQIEVELRTLRRERTKCDREWQLQKVSYITSIAYAVGLMLAFIVLAAPVSAPVAGIMVIAGAAACLAFTVINNAVKGGIELYKTYKTLQEKKQDHDDKVKELLRLLKANPKLDENEKKLLYLEIKQLQAETEYQKQMMIYQSVNLARRIMIEALVPVVVIVSLVAVPLGGLGIIPVLIAVIALAIATKMLVDALFKPEEKKTLEFDEESYEKFCNELEKQQPKIERDRLFSENGKERLLDNDGPRDAPVIDY